LDELYPSQTLSFSSILPIHQQALCKNSYAKKERKKRKKCSKLLLMQDLTDEVYSWFADASR
jgi:hypothetical protein